MPTKSLKAAPRRTRRVRQFLSTAQVAKRLGVTTATVRYMANRRQIGHYRIGKNMKFDKADVKHLVENSYIAASKPR